MVFYEKNSASFGLKIGHPNFELIYKKTSDFQQIMIGETQKYGRALFLDGVIQSTQVDEAIYHEMLVHPLMAHAEKAKRILVAGAGEGASLRELLKHSSVEQIDAVEIDGTMINAARDHLPSWHNGAFDSARVNILKADILEHMAAVASAQYDAILVDLTDPIDEDGEFCADSLIFKPEFLAMLQTALAPGGVIVMQAGEMLSGLTSIFPKLEEQFAWVRPYSVFVPSFHGSWTFIMLGSEDRYTHSQYVDAKLTATENLPVSYFSRLAYQRAAEQADLFFSKTRG